MVPFCQVSLSMETLPLPPNTPPCKDNSPNCDVHSLFPPSLPPLISTFPPLTVDEDCALRQGEEMRELAELCSNPFDSTNKVESEALMDPLLIRCGVRKSDVEEERRREPELMNLEEGGEESVALEEETVNDCKLVKEELPTKVSSPLFHSDGPSSVMGVLLPTIKPPLN